MRRELQERAQVRGGVFAIEVHHVLAEKDVVVALGDGLMVMSLRRIRPATRD
jgi:hypothetical protein